MIECRNGVESMTTNQKKQEIKSKKDEKTTRQENTQIIADGVRDFLKDLDEYKSIGIISEEELNSFVRPSQRDVLEQYLSNKYETGVFDLATGFGKTRIMTILTLGYLNKNPNGRILITVPTTNLIDQIANSMQLYNERLNSQKLDIGFFYKDRKDTKNQVIITTYASLEKFKNKLKKQEKLQEVGLLLLDEAHHAVTDKKVSAVKEFTNAATYGMTGTPWYSMTKEVSELLGNTIARVSVPISIKEGDLAGCKNILLVSNFMVDLSKVRKNTNGDYEEEEYTEAIREGIKKLTSGRKTIDINRDEWNDVHFLISEQVAKFYKSYIDEDVGALNEKNHMKTCMINCRTQKEARIQAEELNKLFGREVAKVWTTDTKDENILKDFQEGKFPIICQVGRLGEGFDMPELEMCINYPTCSKIWEAQRSGRTLRRPDNLKNKMALVVDIAFLHPDYDSKNREIVAIYKNGQVLYQDILKSPFIRQEKYEEELSEEMKGNSPQGVELLENGEIATPQEKVTSEEIEDKPIQAERLLPLEYFHVISRVRDLILLQKEAQEYEASHIILPIRDGMLTSTGLNEEYEIRTGTAAKILNKLLQNKTTFIDENGNEYPLVEWVRSGTLTTPALHESPKAKEKLKKLYPKLFAIKIKEGMLTSTGLAGEYGITSATAAKILNKLLQNKTTFIDEDGNEQLLVEWVKNGPVTTPALRESPKAKEKFKKLYHNLLVPKIRDGMLTSTGLAEKCGINPSTAAKILNKLLQNKVTFIDENGNEAPLVEEVKTWAETTFALHESPKAKEKLKELYPKLFAIKIRDGMLTSIGLAEKHRTTHKTAAKILNKLLQNKVTFIDENGNECPLIELVKSGTQTTPALHESPKAKEKLKELHPGLFAVKIRNGMLTIRELVKEYSTTTCVATKILYNLFQNKATFIDENGNKRPLLEQVKTAAGITSIALHESKNALEEVKKCFKQETGKELKERIHKNKISKKENKVDSPDDTQVESTSEAPQSPRVISHHADKQFPEKISTHHSTPEQREPGRQKGEGEG